MGNQMSKKPLSKDGEGEWRKEFHVHPVFVILTTFVIPSQGPLPDTSVNDDVDVLPEETLAQEEADEGGSLPPEQMVLGNPLLLSKILSLVPARLRKKERLTLRLVSPSFNEAILDSLDKGQRYDGTKTKWPVKLTPNNPFTYVEHMSPQELVVGVDPRLCRHVKLRYIRSAEVNDDFSCLILASRFLSNFSTFLELHGPKIRKLSTSALPVGGLRTFLALVHRHCINLAMLKLGLDGEDRRNWSIDEQRLFHPWTSLRCVMFKAENRETACGRVIHKELSRLVEVAPNLSVLDIRNGDDICIDIADGTGLTSLLLDVEFPNSLPFEKMYVTALNAVAGTLENLKFTQRGGWNYHDQPYQPEVLPYLKALPGMKILKLDIARDTTFVKALWRGALEGRMKSLQSLSIQSSWHRVSQEFWTLLFDGWVSPLRSVHTFSFTGGRINHPSSTLTQKLSKIQHAFPNLSRISLPIPIDPPRSGLGELCDDVQFFQGLTRWDKPFKDIRVTLSRPCSLQDAVVTLEAAGEYFFSNELCLSVQRPLCLEDDRKQLPEDVPAGLDLFSDFARALLRTRNMKKVAFYGFKVPDGLEQFISSNGLPVSVDAAGDIHPLEF